VGVSATVRALLEYAVRHLGDEAVDRNAAEGLEELTPEVWHAIKESRCDNSARENKRAQAGAS
jgi:hypothetical protein